MTSALRLPEHDRLFEGARKVVEILRKHGHEAWIVGGAVRDLALGGTPHEYDVCTSARPDDVMGLFHKTVPVGVQFGVVRVRLMGQEFEVATFRADLGYSDGRRPDAVRFTDLAEDVKRRDFTINGLAMDPFDGTVVDRVGGLDDLRAGRLRAIGDPDARFDEDRLRPLRAVRFAARTGFAIEEGTLASIVRHAPEVVLVSPERIQDELSKLLATPRPGTGLRLLAATGLRDGVLPELAGADAEVGARALDALAGAPLEAMWAALLWPAGGSACAAAMVRLRHSNAHVRDATDIVGRGRDLAALPLGDPAAEKRLLRAPTAAAAVRVLAAWRAAEGLDDAPVQVARERLARWTEADLRPARLATGNDAMASGIPRGPAVAAALTALEDAQLRGEVTDREAALALFRRLAG